MSDILSLNKLTLKDIGTNPKAAAALAKVGERVTLARIYGVANGVKVKEDKQKGEVWTSLKGSFRAKVVQAGVDTEGQTFSSGILYLPPGIQEQIESALVAAGDDAEVTFAVDVFSYRANNAAGFSYGAAMIGEPDTSDPLERMARELEAKPVLGAAPAAPQVEDKTKGKDAKADEKTDA